jgi:beta-lactam-binding protein with PASTA domain
MSDETVKSAPPLLGRYKLLKEKRRLPAYRSFLAYDLKLKRGVVVKLVPVRGFHKKHLPIMWEYLEKAFKNEDSISRVVELDFQKDSLLVVEEYLEGRYFNSQIIENPHDYQRFEMVLYRSADLIKKLHSNKIQHGFLDFRNMKLTQNDAVVLEDYPLLHWLEINKLLPETSFTEKQYDPETRDIRQLGLILFNVYRTQLVPEFHAFPDKYSRDDIYNFFRKNSFSHFSDVERILGGLLLGGEPAKGYANIIKAFNDIKSIVSVIPPPVSPRHQTSPLAKLEVKPPVSEIKPVGSSPTSTQELAKKLGKTVEKDYARPESEVSTRPEQQDVSKWKPDKTPDIRSKRELNEEVVFFRSVAWITLIVSIIVMAVSILFVARGFITSNTHEITTPDLKGLSFEEAGKKARSLGLKLIVSAEEYSEDLPEGLIIEHQPPLGVRTKSGRTVYAILSRGLAVVTVPNVIDLSESAAEDSLVSFQLKAGKKEYVYNEDVELGIVMDQNPPPNSKVAVNDTVDLIISAGLLKSFIPMPDLEGMTLSEATNTIEQKKLRVRRVSRSYSPYFEREAVKYQYPATGDMVEYGMNVDLEVVIPSRDAPPEEFKIAISIELPNFDGRKRVKITNRNQRATRTVYNELHLGREVISLLAEGVGRTQLSVFLDDELINEELF